MSENPATTASPESEQSLLWATLFGDLSGYLGLFSSVPGEIKPTGSVELVSFEGSYFRYPTRSRKALSWVEHTVQKGRELHLCPHLLAGRRRVKKNTAPVKALWADADGAELPGGFPEPTITVRSSPGKRHMYWALRRPLAPEAAETTSRRLTYTIGADPGGWALASLFRLPGTLNQKYPEKPRVQIASYDPSLLYHPREIEQYLQQIEEPTRQEGPPPLTGTTGDSLTIGDLHQLSQKMRDLIYFGNEACGKPYETRSHADFAVVIAMLGAGFEEDAIWQVFKDPSNGISEKYYGRGRYGDYYLNRTIRRAQERAEPAFGPTKEKRKQKPSNKPPQLRRRKEDRSTVTVTRSRRPKDSGESENRAEPPAKAFRVSKASSGSFDRSRPDPHPGLRNDLGKISNSPSRKEPSRLPNALVFHEQFIYIRDLTCRNEGNLLEMYRAKVLEARTPRSFTPKRSYDMTHPDNPAHGSTGDTSTLYQIEISREHTGDLLEEIKAATFLAQVRDDASALENLGEDLTIETRAEGSTSVTFTATDPEVLNDLARMAEDRGYELPDQRERRVRPRHPATG